MEKPQYIVAIGASAGGLEALSAFFEHTPPDSVSYVLIPHLSPDFKSGMVEILARHSELEFLEAEENMQVEINKVYLIPNTKYMGIREGRLFLHDKERQSLPHMTIDAFFSSLALERGPLAIGIILSGVGSDGTQGAIAIEDAGGIIMVQDPSDAKYDGMPKSALNVSDTKYVFSAEALPSVIRQYLNGQKNISTPAGVSLEDEDLIKIVKLIKAHYPYDFTDYKNGTLQRRIKRRMAQHNILDVHSFIVHLQKDPREIELLISDFLIGVTSFFRDPEAFKVLELEVIPKIIGSKTGKELVKIWVSCCATGEEAYSMAILVKEYLIRHHLDTEVKIFATDINEAALKQAAKGIFSLNINKSLSKERLNRFFDRGADSFKIKSEIREMLIFARHDLTKNPPYCYVDLISCRNMLIYIKPVLQKQILSKLAFGINKNGFLFLGSSENISAGKDNFVEISSKWKIYQSIRAERPVSLEGQLTAPISGTQPIPAKLNPSLTAPATVPGLTQDIHELMRLETGFTGVLIDEHGRVSQAFGDLSPYLRQEHFKHHLQELLPENLGLAFSATLQQVLSSNQRKRINNIQFTDPVSLAMSMADLIVSPYTDKKTNAIGMLVLFKPSVDSEQTHPGTEFQIDVQTKAYIARLEAELLEVKQNLTSSNEYLETSREAMQAFNEELLSANEEMQSANEELQSINEELETVNTAYKYTINELTDLNNDLNNYFRSNVNGQLFVDKDILLKKYSPGAVDHINIRDTDIGRPLNNITTNIKLETIIEDIKKVLENGQIITREVENKAGRLYQVMTSPYLKKGSEETYGAIVTFYDITELKKAQHELFKSTNMLRLATVASEMGTWSIDIHNRELTGSSRLNEMFGYPAQHQMTLEMALAQVEQSHQASFLNDLEGAILKDVKFELEFPIIRHSDQASRWIRAIGSLTKDQSGAGEYLTGVMYDVTDHKLDDLRKNDFIAIVSHELKSPLTSIQGYLQLLYLQVQKTDNTFAIGALDKTIKQVKKMNVLINGFLNVSRLEAGKIYLNKQAFEIDLLTREIVAELSGSNPENEIEIITDCDLSIDADRDKIGQVISNLLSNAIKYSPAGSAICISCKKSEDRYMQFDVKDMGMGIEKKDMEKVFDRYFRSEDQNMKMISGFGIGLYLCAEIINSHKGKIWVGSEFGTGSTFSFMLPLASYPVTD